MGVDRTELEKFLKNRLMDASRDGTLHTWNWENEPLPAMVNQTDENDDSDVEDEDDSEDEFDSDDEDWRDEDQDLLLMESTAEIARDILEGKHRNTRSEVVVVKM